MSSYLSSRAASGADRQHTQFKHSDRSNVTADDPEQSQQQPFHQQQPRAGFGVNASDRRVGRRSPFKLSDLPRTETSAKPRSDAGPRPSSASKLGSDATRVNWNPQASLISSTTSAPLASRISVPPLSSLAPKELQPTPFANLSLDEQEIAVTDDLLYVFMGFEGQYIRFVDSYNPIEEKERLVGPEFRIQPGLDLSLRDMTMSMLKMATHYIALEAFIEVQSREEFGTVNQALCAAIRKFLKDYLILVAQLEHQLLTNASFTLHRLNLTVKPTGHMLHQLYVLAQEVLKRNAILEVDLDDSDDANDIDGLIDSLREGADNAGFAGSKVCKGGRVLGLISNRLASMSGDPAAKDLLTSLLREASKPYMAMLNEWLHHGGIMDPHGEFLIKEQKSIKREKLEQDYTDEYWEKRYTIRESDVPPQLETVKDKVLLAGKYLNVVRECGGVDVSKVVKDVPASFDDPRFLDNVNAAYAYANSSLLTLLLTTHALPARLRSLKHYFFLDRSDFFSYFLELGTSELRKPAKTVNTGKLQSLLDIVLRQPGSVAAEDPFKEDVKVAINDVGLTSWLMRIVNVTGLDTDQANAHMTNLLTPAAPTSAADDRDLTGFDALVFDYTVPFPLSLVISRVTLTRYQLLFRYLLSLRHLETLLAGSWFEHSKGSSWRHRSNEKQVELWKRKAWTLRARMLCFVQQLLYFSTSEVIEPNWQALMTRLRERDKDDDDGSSSQTKRTVDELMQDHVDFLATCLKECMLTNAKLLKINSKLMNSCTMFAQFTSSFTRYLTASDQELSTQPQSRPTTTTTNNEKASTGAGTTTNSSQTATFDPSKFDRAVEILQKYEDYFNRHLKILLDALNYLAATETVVFLGLCARLGMAGAEVPGMSVANYG